MSEPTETKAPNDMMNENENKMDSNEEPKPSNPVPEHEVKRACEELIRTLRAHPDQNETLSRVPHLAEKVATFLDQLQAQGSERVVHLGPHVKLSFRISKKDH